MRVRRSDVVTLPNGVTLLRLCLLPFYVLLMSDGRIVAGAFMLGSLGATDWVDGYLARRFNQVSELGKVLDPVVDRLVFFVGVSTALYYSGIPLWFGVAILVREGFVALLMLIATLFGMQRFGVTYWGKWATFLLLGAVPWVLAGSEGGVWRIFWVLGWILGVPGLILSYITAVQYIPMVRAHMRPSEYRKSP